MIATTTSIGIITVEDIYSLIQEDEQNVSTLPTSTEEQESLFDEIKENESVSLFPNSIVKVYPGIKEVHAKEPRTCDFSGACIFKGSLYVRFRPMIRDITNNEAYVLKRTITAEISYEKMLPETISELEVFCDNISNCENLIDTNPVFEHLHSQIGNLVFKKLKKRRPYENRNSKRS